MKQIIRYILFNNVISKHLSDASFIKLMYWIRVGKRLNLKNPKTFNEKMQWLKLHDRKQSYTLMVDKYEAKQIVEKKVGSQFVVSNIGVWDKFEDIDFELLPNKFVLKCTHDSGSVFVCEDKEKINIGELKEKFKKFLARDYYMSGREWPYKNVKHRIIAEEYISDKDHKILPVYKVFNFCGEPKIIQVIQDDKSKNETIDYFDISWNKIDLKQNYSNSKKQLNKPKQLEKMLEICRKLSAGIPFIRIDFYYANDKVFFSEFTFYSDGGFEPFHPESYDELLGSWIELPRVKTIAFIGGLGNQLYQCALGESLLNKNIDISYSNQAINTYAKKYKGSMHEGFEINTVFDLDLPLVNVPNYYYDSKPGYGLIKKYLIKSNKYIKSNQSCFDEETYKKIILDAKYIDGYWCDYRYSSDILEKANEHFRFKNMLDDRNKEVEKEIENTISCSIHVRRGDYLNHSDDYCILDNNYYLKAVDDINKKYGSVTYFIFSDDIKWCKDNLKLQNVKYVDWNKGNDSYKDMQLMSLCKINIIANSTFSEWAAYLNKNEDKMIVAPKHIFKKESSFKDYQRSADWIYIENDN